MLPWSLHKAGGWQEWVAPGCHMEVRHVTIPGTWPATLSVTKDHGGKSLDSAPASPPFCHAAFVHPPESGCLLLKPYLQHRNASVEAWYSQMQLKTWRHHSPRSHWTGDSKVQRYLAQLGMLWTRSMYEVWSCAWFCMDKHRQLP